MMKQTEVVREMEFKQDYSNEIYRNETKRFLADDFEKRNKALYDPAGYKGKKRAGDLVG